MKTFAIQTPQQLGLVLQGFRKSRSLTQADVGSRAGLAQKEVSKMELDSTTTTLGRIFKLLSALELELVVRERGAGRPAARW